MKSYTNRISFLKGKNRKRKREGGISKIMGLQDSELGPISICPRDG
jgi:hypothetical protein